MANLVRVAAEVVNQASLVLLQMIIGVSKRSCVDFIVVVIIIIIC